MRQIYLAQQNADLTEGRGPMVTRGAFTLQVDAERAARDLSGVMGVGHGTTAVMDLYESYGEWKNGRDAEVKQRALAKLNPEERRALGFS